MVRVFLHYRVIPFTFLLEFKGDSNTMRKFTLGVAVLQKYLVFEEPDVP